MNTNNQVRIAVSTMPINAGETTRAVEICKSVREQAAAAYTNLTVDIRFFATLYSTDQSVSFEHFITDAGFDLEKIGPGCSSSERQMLFDREHEHAEFVQPEEKDRVVQAITKTKEAFERYKPTIVLYGFSYDMTAQVASKILNIPSALYLPLPTDMDFLKDVIYDDLPYGIRRKGLWILPKPIRRKLLQYYLASPNAAGNQPTLRAAAVEAGYTNSAEDKQVWLWDILQGDILLVNDLPGNYVGYDLHESTILTGPVFPFNDNDDAVPEIDPDVLRVFCPSHPNKVFIAMGSSGHRKDLVQAIKAVSKPTPDGNTYYVVALVPPSMCSLDEMRRDVFGNKSEANSNIYLTDKFVPAKHVSQLADVAIIHGGQGTVQTAMGAGTPIVSIGLQPEQDINLLQVCQRRRAGIKLERHQWKEATIANAVECVLEDPSYKECANTVKKEMDLCDGSAVSAEAIVKFARSNM